MKKKFLYIIIIVSCMLVNAMTKDKSESTLLVDINGNNINGQINSIVIPLRDFIFFFNDEGECIKRISYNKAHGTIMFSSNHKYISEIQYRNDKYLIRLIKYNGETLWEKNYEHSPSVIGISNDGKRVFIRLSTESEIDYPIIKCVNEQAKELFSVKGLEIINMGVKHAISDNGLYWACVPFNNNMSWSLYKYDGESIQEFKYKAQGTLKAIGDNGNILFEVNDSLVLIDYRLNVIKRFPGSLTLSQSGEVYFYFDKSSFYFENQNETIEIDKKQIDRHTENKQRILHKIEENFERDGNFVIIRLWSTSDLSLLLLFKNGEINTKKISLNWASNEGVHYMLIDQQKYLAIYNREEDRCKVYLIRGKQIGAHPTIV